MVPLPVESPPFLPDDRQCPGGTSLLAAATPVPVASTHVWVVAAAVAVLAAATAFGVSVRRLWSPQRRFNEVELE